MLAPATRSTAATANKIFRQTCQASNRVMRVLTLEENTNRTDQRGLNSRRLSQVRVDPGRRLALRVGSPTQIPVNGPGVAPDGWSRAKGGGARHGGAGGPGAAL